MYWPVFFLNRRGRTRIAETLRTHTVKRLRISWPRQRNQETCVCHVQSSCGQLGPQQAFMTKECALLSLTAKVNATCALPSHTKSATIQFPCLVRDVTSRKYAAQNILTDDSWAGNWSKNTTCHQIVADTGPLVVTSFRWWYSRSSAPTPPALTPCHQKFSKRAWNDLQARQIWLCHFGWCLWRRRIETTACDPWLNPS